MRNDLKDKQRTMTGRPVQPPPLSPTKGPRVNLERLESPLFFNTFSSSFGIVRELRLKRVALLAGGGR